MVKNLRPNKRWLPFIIYALLAFAILGPLLKSGDIFALDSPYSLNQSFPNKFFGLDEWYPSASLPSDFIISFLDRLMPVWMWQKGALLLIFFLAGLGAHRLFPIKGLPQYYAGILYMINPFTAVRFFAGHWVFLAGYAIITFALKAFLDLLSDGNNKNIGKVVFLTTLTGLIQLHPLFLLLLAFCVLFMSKLISVRHERSRAFHLLKSTGIAAVFFLVLNVYSIIPNLTATGTIIQQKSSAEIALFAPKSTSGFGVVFD